MAKRRKKKPSSGAPLSPEKYVIQRGRSLELEYCLANPNWQETGMAQVMVVRKQPSGFFASGMYLLDTYCLGLKDTTSHIRLQTVDVENLIQSLTQISQSKLEKISYELAHNLIYGSIDYADELGFRPHKDFRVTQHLLEDDENETIPILDLEFGKDGKPFYIPGPYDNSDQVLIKLMEKLGPDGFEFAANPAGFD
ncbi:MAG: hypothetical protein AAGI38_23570 [Bacteroidota bacterium]